MNLPNQISGTFNKTITLGTGSLRVYKDDSLFLTFTESDIVVSGNTFTIDISNLFPDNGIYDVSFDSGLFLSGLEVFAGLPIGTWQFTITDGYYDATYYDSNYYLT